MLDLVQPGYSMGFARRLEDILLVHPLPGHAVLEQLAVLHEDHGHAVHDPGESMQPLFEKGHGDVQE